jgi:hypothetical protein
MFDSIGFFKCPELNRLAFCRPLFLILVVKLDLNEVAHLDLLYVVDHVLVVLQGVPLLVLHGRVPERCGIRRIEEKTKPFKKL